MLFTLCDLFAHRYTPDRQTKLTRMTSVFYSTLKDPTETGQNKTNMHHRVFLNTHTRDSHPTASPEGPRTTPSEKCQRWFNARPLGAAMRLTAVRRSPKEFSKLKNSGHPKSTPKLPNGSRPQLLCKRRIIFPCTEGSENAGPRAAPCDSVRAPGIHVCSHPLPKLITIGAGACYNRMIPSIVTKKLSQKEPQLTDPKNHNGTLHKGKPLICITLSHIAITKKVSQASHSTSPHNSCRTLESKEMSGRLRHSARGSWAVVRRHALARRRRSTPTLTLNIGSIRRFVAPPPLPSNSIDV